MKLIGVMQDSTTKSLANITQQLNNITERITDMDKKLDELSSGGT